MRKILAGIIVLYQKYMSPFLPRSCRFYPTCSEYARQAILKYGSIKGSALGVWRILRCNPFGKGGIDEVK
ncbi:MAG TPA: membrane protein insertion efficiency factor YidD [Candidatus Goldiibacteriota bacterium]|nr:membrane protein insertion efficiency factor YidD [Candidatus Goldiibacteriota bacterium]